MSRMARVRDFAVINRAIVRTAILLLAGLASACQGPNHYLIYPHRTPPGVVTWSEEAKKGRLLIHLEWAKPDGSGLFPAILVHPEAGGTASDMRGVISNLAQHGYVAVAADYRRLIDGKYRRTLFPWRQQSDVTAALDIVQANPSVDTSRIATLGFSQGGVFSLLIAAHAPERIKAVVAYYPVTDFEGWLNPASYPNPMRRFVYRMIRRYFRKQSGAQSEGEFIADLRRASPIDQVRTLRAPVLLIHGASDTSAPVSQSEQLAAALRGLGRQVHVIIIPNAGHVFNFKNKQEAIVTWNATLRWFDEYLKPLSRKR